LRRKLLRYGCETMIDSDRQSRTWREPFETGEAHRRRAHDDTAQTTVDVTFEVVPDPYVAELMESATPKHIGGGTRSVRTPKRPLRPLVRYCAGCRRFHTGDISVCPTTGAVLVGEPQRDILGPPRDAIIAPEYAAFLENSKPSALRLRDIINFLTYEPRFRAGHLSEWADSIRAGKSLDRDRDVNERGAPRLFGRVAGVEVTEKLPLSLEATLKAHGVGFHRGSPLTLTHVADMALTQYAEYLTLLMRPAGWGIPEEAMIPDCGAIALLDSSQEECERLTAIVQRPDLDAIILAALQRNGGE
jgi:hypothetical protein